MILDQVSQHHFSSGNLVFLLPVKLVTSLLAQENIQTRASAQQR